MKQEENGIGPFRKLYAGYAARSMDRARVAAGGLMTSLLATALREGLVDGVVLCRSDFSQEKMGYAIDIVTNADEIPKYGKSVYFNIPIERETRRLDQFNGKLAICALPCQARIIRRTQQGGKR